jgi:hypothetical protein
VPKFKVGDVVKVARPHWTDAELMNQYVGGTFMVIEDFNIYLCDSNGDILKVSHNPWCFSEKALELVTNPDPIWRIVYAHMIAREICDGADYSTILP